MKFQKFSRHIILALSCLIFSNKTLATTCVDLFAPPPSRTLEQESDYFFARAHDFMSKNLDKVQVLEKVKVHFNEPKSGAKFDANTKLLVISLHGQSQESINILRASVLSTMGEYSSSFVMKSGATHLYTRFKEEVLDYDYRWGASANGDAPENWSIHLFQHNYRLPSPNTDVIEPIVLFTRPEFARYNSYVENAKRDVISTVGRFNMDGSARGGRDLNQNLPPVGLGHNCTSWLMTAPVGVDGTSLLGLLGPRTQFNDYVATNPGWLLAYMLTHANPGRVPVNIFWTSKPLAEAVNQLERDGLTNWNFNPH